MVSQVTTSCGMLHLRIEEVVGSVDTGVVPSSKSMTARNSSTPVLSVSMIMAPGLQPMSQTDPWQSERDRATGSLAL